MERAHPHDMETVGPALKEQVEFAQPAFGSFLPQIVVDAQLELARLSEHELAARFGHLIVAMALRHPGLSPRKVLAARSEQLKIRDEAWYERTGPELRRILAEHGISL